MKISNETFLKIKKTINFLVCLCIIMSVLFFGYWLVISMHIVIPPFLNSFFMFFNSIVESFIKGTAVYEKLVILIPIIVSFMFIILTYALNCLATYVENLHKQYLDYQTKQKKLLEQTINEQLKQAFIKELAGSNYMMIKLKLKAVEEESYLHKYDTPVDIEKITTKMHNEIMQKTAAPYILEKGFDNNHLYFIAVSPGQAQEIFKTLVDTSIDVIGKNMTERMSVSFFCGADLYDSQQEVQEKKNILERMLELGLKNRIIVSSRFKTYFSELYPEYFTFKNAGEYNLVGSTYKSAYSQVYTIQRKNRL